MRVTQVTETVDVFAGDKVFRYEEEISQVNMEIVSDSAMKAVSDSAIETVTESAISAITESAISTESIEMSDLVIPGTDVVQEKKPESVAEKETVNKKVPAKKNVVQKSKTVKTTKTKKKYTNSELRLMSCIIYAEANGEPYAGKLAVGIVVKNRQESKTFPNTIKGVIYQKYQFGPARNGSLNRALREYDAGRFTSSAEKACIKAAKEALNGTKKVKYGSKTYNMKGFYYFSTYVKGKRLTIKNHQFK